ncbi:Endo-1,3-1,4-beta-D-glucanase [Glycine soja]
MRPQCCSNPPSLNPTGGGGLVDKVGGIDSYFTGSPHSKLAVLMLSDVFGYEAPNLRKLADKVGAAGYYVVVPDLLDGEPFNPQNSDRPFPAWIKDHGPVEKGAEPTKPIIEALKSKGVSAIAAVGFCWGAKVVIELAKSKLIQTAVLLHPSFISLDDIKGVDTPIAILGAEIDQVSPPELVKQFEQVLAAKSGLKLQRGVKKTNQQKMSGPQCCSNPPSLNPSGGGGHVNKVGGVDSYFSGSFHSKLALLMLSDVFGYEAPNLRKLADKVAAAGYYVVVPDLLDGEPFNYQNSNRPLPVWLKDHGPDKGSEATKPIIEALKSKGVSVIAAVGFCWGAKVVVELVKSKLIQTAVLMHPSFVASFVKIFPKISHGWAVRYNAEDAEAVKVAEEAHRDMLDWLAKHHKNIADKVAAAGYYVVVPDFFHGDPYNPENASRSIPVWLKDHGTDKGSEAAKSIIEALKSKGVMAIGAAGFCWGAKVVVELAKSRLIQAAVLLHPSFVSVDDIKGVDTPTAVLGAEIDKMSPPELVKQFEQVLTAKPGVVDCFVKIFPKVSHGWTVRFNPKDAETVKAAAEEAHQDMLNWFAKHLKELADKVARKSGNIADKVAATGYYVVVPDFFNGEPYDPENVKRPKEKGIEVAKPVIEALKSKGVTAIGAAGFCWGGVKIPIAILGAENDKVACPPTLVKQWEEILKAKPEIDSYVEIFPNVSHGWTVRYDPKDPSAVKAADKAHQIMIGWFDKHLK